MVGCMEDSSSQGLIQCLLIGLILPKDKYKGPFIIYVDGGGGGGWEKNVRHVKFSMWPPH